MRKSHNTITAKEVRKKRKSLLFSFFDLCPEPTRGANGRLGCLHPNSVSKDLFSKQEHRLINDDCSSPIITVSGTDERKGSTNLIVRQARHLWPNA